MQSVKITTVGASSGVILTKEIMAHLKVKKGDTLYLTETADGGYRLTPYNPEFVRQMELADEIMHERPRGIARARQMTGAAMKNWRWVEPAVIYAVHDRQLSEHGGFRGHPKR